MSVEARERRMNEVVQNVDVDDDEERLDRVAAIDVAKASGKVCVRLPAGSDGSPSCGTSRRQRR